MVLTKDLSSKLDFQGKLLIIDEGESDFNNFPTQYAVLPRRFRLKIED
jgi:hypothetical protein